MYSLHKDDDGGRGDFFPRFPDDINQIAVLSASSVAVTVPTGARYVIFGFEPNANVAVRRNGAATYPAGTLGDGEGALINPAQFNVEEVTDLHFIAKDTDTVVSLAFYS